MESEQSNNDQRLSGQRMLAAIMFTDVAGFSIHMGEDEERTMRCVERDLRLVTTLCGQFHGRVLKRMGDGILAIFLSAVGSVECAQEIQRQLAEQARGLDPEEVFHHRIGIHLGDVFIQDDEVMGDGVNIAARLQNEAPPGGICISQALYGVVKRRLNIKTVHQGAKHLKNIREQVHIYQLIMGDAPSGKAFAPFNARRNTLKHIAIPVFVFLILTALIYSKAWERLPGPEQKSATNSFTIADNFVSPREATITPTELKSETRDSDPENDGIIERVEDAEETNTVATEPDRSSTPLPDSSATRREPPHELPIDREPEARLFKRFDVDQDGKLARSEIPLRTREQIMRADFDKDGMVTWDEIIRGIRMRRDAHKTHPPPRNP